MSLNRCLIVCKDQCDCGSNFVKDPHCSGDYYPTHIGIVLMRFCPECGIMRPLVSQKDPDYISNSEKYRAGNIIASKFKFRYKEIRQVVHRLKDIKDRKKFAEALSKIIGVPFNEIYDYYV